MDVKLLRPLRHVSTASLSPFCDAEVVDQTWCEPYKTKRAEASVAAGRRPMQCSKRASIQVDGVPYCSIHAGPAMAAKAVGEKNDK